MAVPQQSTVTDPVYGVMICGHGSRSKSAVTEFAVLAEKAPIFFLIGRLNMAIWNSLRRSSKPVLINYAPKA